MVTKPKSNLGFYGNIVAAPVFKEIRNLLYAEEPIEIPEFETNIAAKYIGKVQEINSIHKELQYPISSEEEMSVFLKSNKASSETLIFEENLMPNLNGMASMDAVYLLENLGLQVKLNGKGKVRTQSLKAGNKIKGTNKITLSLS